MKVAVLSDLHDNVATWKIIAKELTEQKIEALLFCGDMCSPAMMAEVVGDFSGPMFLVFGNVDGDQALMVDRSKEFENLTIMGERGEVELDGKKFFLTHYPDVARAFAKAGEHDVVCYGHDHIKHQSTIGKTILLNPGTAGGMFQYPSYAIVDTQTLNVEFKNPTM